jgi:hypothetical protein
VDPRLRAIGTPSIRTDAVELVKLGLAALDELKKIDESLYGLFVATKGERTDPEMAAAKLRLIWDGAFYPLKTLLEFCRGLATEAAKASTTVDGDLDFGDFEAQEEKSFELDIGDIGNLLGGLDGEGGEQRSDADKWAEVKEKLAAIEYGLRTQLEDATERRDVALGAGQTGQVLGLLDDTTSSASEGIHALVSAVYAAFVPDADTAHLVPEYLTSLKRALMVRKGIAELSGKLGPLNDALQGSDVGRHADALEGVKAVLKSYVMGDVCRAMRAADRWELVQFDQRLGEESPAAARMTSEGLVKYLESLGAINQREVLVQHDQRVLDELREAVTTARALMEISPRTAHEMAVKACRSSLALRGRHPATDAMLVKLATLDLAASSPSQSPALLERLEQLLAASGG